MFKNIFIYFYLFLNVFDCFAGMYVCVLCACRVQGNYKRKSDPLRGELQMVVSHRMSIGNQTQVFWVCFLIAESSLQSPGYKDYKMVLRPRQLLFLSKFGCFGKIPKADWSTKGRSLFHSALQSESLILCGCLRLWWGLVATSQDGGGHLREDTWESQRGSRSSGEVPFLSYCSALEVTDQKSHTSSSQWHCAMI